MPLVQISVSDRADVARRRLLADAVYDAMRASLGIPEGDRFIIVSARPEGELFVDPTFMGMQRTIDHVLVHVTLRRGRTAEVKQAFYAETARLLGERAGVAPDDVMIVLSENESPDWSFGRGQAQFLAPKP
jgi:4-oxalocrotonate tautomerase